MGLGREAFNSTKYICGLQLWMVITAGNQYWSLSIASARFEEKQTCGVIRLKKIGLNRGVFIETLQ